VYAFQAEFDQTLGYNIGMTIAIMAAFTSAIITLCDLRAWLRNRATLVSKHDDFLDKLKKESPHVLELITAHQLKCMKYSIENVLNTSQHAGSQPSRISQQSSSVPVEIIPMSWIYSVFCCFNNEVQPEKTTDRESPRPESRVESHFEVEGNNNNIGKLERLSLLKTGVSSQDDGVSAKESHTAAATPADPAYLKV
jgi:hypothetical protein